MFPNSAKITTRMVKPSVFIFDIQGEVNSGAENSLLSSYAEANDQGAKHILLNFKEMSYLNSSGIGLLIILLIRCKRSEQSLIAYNLEDHYRNIFDLTRLNEAVRIYPSEAEALGAINGSG